MRVLSATNRPVLEDLQTGRLREDLYYRLAVFPIQIPPLRHRRGDILPLAGHFVRQFSPSGGPVSLSDAAKERLFSHPWPGNVRELRNVIYRALLLRRGPSIEVDDLHFDDVVAATCAGESEAKALADHERELIEKALRRSGGNRNVAAAELGISLSTLFRRLKEWGIDVPHRTRN